MKFFEHTTPIDLAIPHNPNSKINQRQSLHQIPRHDIEMTDVGTYFHPSLRLKEMSQPPLTQQNEIVSHLNIDNGTNDLSDLSDTGRHRSGVAEGAGTA
jgi:hypothetical protein